MSDSAEELLAPQGRFLYRNGALTEQFEHMHESERKQVVRAVAIQQLEENSAGLPLRNLDSLSYQAALDMAEALQAEPPSEGIEGLREAGIPVRETAGKAPHEVVADLADVLPSDHPDSETVKSLLTAGSALSADQRHEGAVLANKHSALLAQNGDETVKESLRALREAGVVTRGDMGINPEADAPRELTGLAALVEAGVTIREAD
jgi:hypothetical protein